MCPSTPATTFAFFADARNLERLTPPWLHFEILSPGAVDLEAGSLIDYRLRLRGVPIRWQSEITVWQPPSRFDDVQRKGPYRLWEHTHSFEPIGDGTLVRDLVVYAVPGDVLVNRLVVKPDLERVFDFRARQLNAWVLELQRRNAIRGSERAGMQAPRQTGRSGGKADTF
jgi:ligand-binding SRPBCC domain-containing protein